MTGTFASGALHRFELTDLGAHTEIDPDHAVAAAQRVIEHAVNLADAETLMEMLGLDVPPALMKCCRCLQPMGSIAHLNRCEPQTLDRRVMALADSVGGAA